eukprot:1157097-Pelagomonas_calceolata.AAC.13
MIGVSRKKAIFLFAWLKEGIWRATVALMAKVCGRHGGHTVALMLWTELHGPSNTQTGLRCVLQHGIIAADESKEACELDSITAEGKSIFLSHQHAAISAHKEDDERH